MQLKLEVMLLNTECLVDIILVIASKTSKNCNRLTWCDVVNVKYFCHITVLPVTLLGKIHLLFRFMPLILWSVMLCRPCFHRFWGTEIYTPSVFRIYADIQGWRAEIVSQTRCFVMRYINVIFIKFIKFTTYEIVLI
jgi:hypothetical protein